MKMKKSFKLTSLLQIAHFQLCSLFAIYVIQGKLCVEPDEKSKLITTDFRKHFQILSFGHNCKSLMNNQVPGYQASTRLPSQCQATKSLPGYQVEFLGQGRKTYSPMSL